MNTQYILKKIRPYVVDGKLTYDDFEKIFGFLPLKEQYPICYAVQDDLKIELVDEINFAPDEEEISEELEPLILREAREIKVPNKFLIRLIQNGDEQARQDLCVKNSRLVGKFALKYSELLSNKLEIEDLIQEGNIGLITAAEKFDFTKDTAFSTYAVYWIEQAVSRAIIDTGLTVRLPVHLVEKILKATKLDREFQMQNVDTRRRLELIAKEMETTEEEVRRFFKLRDVYLYIKSLDEPVNEESDTLLKDFIPDEKNPLEETVTLVLLREQLEKVLGTLTGREREVLNLRYGLEDGKERTLEEVGKIFDVTRERIRQIEAKALRKLRHPERLKKLRDFL